MLADGSTTLAVEVLRWQSKYSAGSQSTLLAVKVLHWQSKYSAGSQSTQLAVEVLCWQSKYSAGSKSTLLWLVKVYTRPPHHRQAACPLPSPPLWGISWRRTVRTVGECLCRPWPDWRRWTPTQSGRGGYFKECAAQAVRKEIKYSRKEIKL